MAAQANVETAPSDQHSVVTDVRCAVVCRRLRRHCAVGEEAAVFDGRPGDSGAPDGGKDRVGGRQTGVD